jgi:phosphoserine phosphatase
MNLIIQGADIATPDLKHIAKIAGASSIEAITPSAFRLCNASEHADIAPFCEQARLDFAFVPAERPLANLRLAVMNMESTLITIDCIGEIADMQGIKTQAAAIAAAATRGEIDYAQSLRERVALLKGLDAASLQRVYDERVRLSSGAEIMTARFRRLGIKILLVSGSFAFFTERIRERLQLDYTRSNVLEIDGGKLTGNLSGEIVDASVKRQALIGRRDELGISNDQIICIGHGANDTEFMNEAGVSIACRANPVVRARATHALSFVGLDGVLNLFN